VQLNEALVKGKKRDMTGFKEEYVRQLKNLA
jgi:hypothetical protein